MSKHLALRSGNPALSSSTFKNLSYSSSESSMTIQGTVHKTGLSLILCILSAGYVWGNPAMHILAMPAGIIGFILAMVTVFKPNLGYITVPIYAIVQGAFLGVINSSCSLMNILFVAVERALRAYGYGKRYIYKFSTFRFSSTKHCENPKLEHIVTESKSFSSKFSAIPFFIN